MAFRETLDREKTLQSRFLLVLRGPDRVFVGHGQEQVDSRNVVVETLGCQAKKEKPSRLILLEGHQKKIQGLFSILSTLGLYRHSLKG